MVTQVHLDVRPALGATALLIQQFICLFTLNFTCNSRPSTSLNTSSSCNEKAMTSISVAVRGEICGNVFPYKREFKFATVLLINPHVK